jgi:hypothetical protein
MQGLRQREDKRVPISDRKKISSSALYTRKELVEYVLFVACLS